MTDEILDELHRVREEYAAKFNFDVALMFADLREKQAKSGREIVSFPEDRINMPGGIDKKAA